MRSRTVAVALACAVGLSSLSACADSGGGDSLSGQKIRWIVSSSAGGGFDTTTRQLEPTMKKELHASSITVENREGGGFAIGAQAALNAPPDCTTVVTHGVPHLNFSYMAQDVDYDLSDFAPVGGISTEPGVLRVRNDAPWDSIEDFVKDARSRPGKIKVSVSDLQSNNYIAMLQMENALDIDLNVIGYDGGDPSRTALVAGEVDATHAGVFNSLSIEDDTKVLALWQPENKWPDLTNDAPTVNDALGADLPANASNYVLLTSAGCKDEQPERYDQLVSSLQSSLGDDDYTSRLKKLGEEAKVEPLPPDEVTDLAKQNQAEIEEILQENPDAFSG